MKNSRKIQLKAFSTALVEHSTKLAAEGNLSLAQTNAVKQKALFSAPHSAMETYKTNKLYSTMIKAGNLTKQNVESRMKTD